MRCVAIVSFSFARLHGMDSAIDKSDLGSLSRRRTSLEVEREGSRSRSPLPLFVFFSPLFSSILPCAAYRFSCRETKKETALPIAKGRTYHGCPRTPSSCMRLLRSSLSPLLLGIYGMDPPLVKSDFLRQRSPRHFPGLLNDGLVLKCKEAGDGLNSTFKGVPSSPSWGSHSEDRVEEVNLSGRRRLARLKSPRSTSATPVLDLSRV
ncbi:hypothetical protein NL676_014634 [Syzygium grande]|nr:hypothetical protein NL676_014634 [Syzygium grande]